MSNQKRQEFGRFFLVGTVSTAADYLLLNFLVVVLDIPLLVANSISAPFSSFLSYKLNKNIVFEGRMHGKRKTFLLYIAIVGFGILVIQNSVLYVLQGSVAQDIASFLMPFLKTIGLGSMSEQTVAINVAKIGASLVAALWNFFMLRRFVFTTEDEDETS